jgi:hypothetical protein
LGNKGRWEQAPHSGEDGSLGRAESRFHGSRPGLAFWQFGQRGVLDTLNVTDIHTTWTESGAVLGRGEQVVQRALNEIAGRLPFRLLAVDSDNGSEFINWHLKRWCEQKEIQLTRGRPYTWLNLFLPSVKLLKKVRVGSKVRRVYDGPRTPLERVRACAQADREKVIQLEELRKPLDPFQLAKTIERKLERIYRLANRRLSPKEVQEAASRRRGKGCGKDARSASLEMRKRFPLSHSHGGDGESTVRLQMSRRPSLGLHS